MTEREADIQTENDRSYRKRKPFSVKYFDYGIVMLVVFLLGFGMVMLYSASSYTAAMRHGSASFFLIKQARTTIIGLVGMAIVSRIDYHWLDKISLIIYIAAVILCIYVLLRGAAWNNSARWIRLGPINFQPSEIGKAAVIIFASHIISNTSFRKRKIEDRLKALAIAIAPLLVIVMLVSVTNLSTGIIILLISFGMLFIAYPKARIFVAFGGVGVVLGGFFLNAAGYRSIRVKIWKHPEMYPKDGFQTLQGLYAIGSGGLFGKGLGQSLQKKFVPEAQNDMIFSLICEELGLFGAVCVIIIFAILLWRIMNISLNASDKLGSFIAAGVMIHVALQVLMNIAVVTNLMPNTGVTLPFISYGGSSVLMLLAEIGIVLNVSRSIDFSA